VSRSRRSVWVAALLTLLALVSAACTSAQQPQADPGAPRPGDGQLATSDLGPAGGGTLRIGLGVDPVSIDPRFVVDDEGELIVDALFDPLVRLDRRSRVVPAAAERWTMSPDGREFTFELREAVFHDGTPVTAADFKRSFDRIADGTAEPASFLAYLLTAVEGAAEAQERGGGLAGVEAVDASTLVIRLDEPQPAFLRVLADPSLVPVPTSADEDLEAFAAQPVGNGPFAMREPREQGTFLRLSRNEAHVSPPLLDEVVFQVYADDPTRDRQWADLLAGQLQVAQVPTDRLDEAAERFGRSEDGYLGPGLLDGITSTVYLYGFETSQPPFDDARVRRAISMAIDREALADDVMQGTRVAADGLVPPPFLGSQRGSCAHCRHDPQAAAALFEEVRAELDADRSEETAEGENGEEGTREAGEEAPTGDAAGAAPQDTGSSALDRLTLTHNRGRSHAAIAQRMASDIESALGIDVVLAARDLQPFVQAVRSGTVPFFRLGWDPGEADAGGYLYPLFHSSQIGLDNVTRYEDPEVDRLLDQARGSTEPGLALARYRQAERLILTDAPALPLLWYRHSVVVAPQVENLFWSPLGRIDLAAVSLDPEA
jgi:oligopeptide transport system substrate-binding protein